MSLKKSATSSWCYCVNCGAKKKVAPGSECPNCGPRGLMENMEPYLALADELKGFDFKAPNTYQEFLDMTAK